jgi:chitinase
MSVEPHDDSFLQTIAGFKASNPALKIMLSVGGWNFPSAYFSAMSSSAANRAIFIQSVVAWLSKYSADGVDLDWEYPCSPPRSDPVEISCTDFQTVPDAGGSCPEDTTNIVLLMKELSAALTPLEKTIAIASQAGKPQELEMAVAALYPYVSERPRSRFCPLGSLALAPASI